MSERKRELKTKKIEVLCTESQYEKIASKAEKIGMSLSEFGLFTMLNSDINVSVGRDPALGRIEAAVKLLESGRIDRREFDVLKEKIIAGLKK